MDYTRRSGVPKRFFVTFFGELYILPPPLWAQPCSGLHPTRMPKKGEAFARPRDHPTPRRKPRPPSHGQLPFLTYLIRLQSFRYTLNCAPDTEAHGSDSRRPVGPIETAALPERM